jgi:hypothetical protein
MKLMKSKFKVIVKNSSNEIEVMHAFDNIENAIICFNEFQTRYSYFHKISIESIII